MNGAGVAAAPSAGTRAFVPVVHSVLAPAAVREFVAGTFGMGRGAVCELLLAGMNDSYYIRAGSRQYVARVYRNGWRSASEIGYELAVLQHLEEKGVPVSTPIAAPNGELLHRLAAPEGPRHVVLFAYAEGEPLQWTEAAHCTAAGRLLGALHNATDDFTCAHDRAALDTAYLIDRPLTEIRPVLERRPDDWSFLEGFAGRLRSAVHSTAGRLDWGVCHGDFSSTGNFHMAKNGVLTVFDFDLCGPGWRAYDLGPIQRAAMGYRDDRIFDLFLAGYREIRDLAAGDHDAVPLFHAISHLWSLGTRARNVARWGTLFMGDWYVDWQLDFFRRWAAEHFPAGV